MIQKYFLFIVAILFTQHLVAQNYSIEQIYERSHNSKIKIDGKAGLIDQNKTLLIPTIYDDVNDYKNGFARVIKNGKVGFVNMKADEIIPCVYEIDTLHITGAVIERILDGNSKQEFLAISINEDRLGFSEEKVSVIKNGKYGFVNKDHHIVIPFQYDGADNFFHEIAIVKLNNKYGTINKSGKIIDPIVYDLLVWENSSTPTIHAQKDGKIFSLEKSKNK